MVPLFTKVAMAVLSVAAKKTKLKQKKGSTSGEDDDKDDKGSETMEVVSQQPLYTCYSIHVHVHVYVHV